MSKRFKTIFFAAALACFSAPAMAGLVVLDFEGIFPTYPIAYGDYTDVGGFYNGGASGMGTSGVNYGVTFDNSAIAGCLNTATDECGFSSHGGLGNPASQYTGLSSTSYTSLTMNVADGFEKSLSLNYAAVYYALTAKIYDGLNGKGQLLGTAKLNVTSTNCADNYQADFCPFSSVQIDFSGLAKSLVISGYVAFAIYDDIAFYTPATADVPEPLTLSLFGAGLIGMAAASRRKRK